MQNFTHEDFIKYYYNESSPDEAVAIKALLTENSEYKKIYEEIVLTFSVLIDIKTEVSDRTIEKIIHYANKVTSKLHLN